MFLNLTVPICVSQSDAARDHDMEIEGVARVFFLSEHLVRFSLWYTESERGKAQIADEVSHLQKKIKAITLSSTYQVVYLQASRLVRGVDEVSSENNTFCSPLTAECGSANVLTHFYFLTSQALQMVNKQTNS